MNLLGLDFYVDDSAFIPAPVIFDDMNSVTVQNSTVDELYVTSDMSRYNETTPSTWETSTVIHAHFDGNLLGGNLAYKAEEITAMRLKRRKVGTFEWLPIYEQPIYGAEDFSFTYIDRFAAVGEYEYCLVPVMGTLEQNYMTAAVNSDFDGIIICDSLASYQTVANLGVSSVVQNRPSSVVTTLENRYPYVNYLGSANYQSGSVNGFFVEIDWKEKRFRIEEGHQYRNELLAFLTDGQAKILKTSDGRIWMVNIVDSPTLSAGEHPHIVDCSFEFVEVGDVNDANDMYENGFSNVDAAKGLSAYGLRSF